ncbi:uncharacterized protein [Aquarana catesbeiana]|uniref:uncharacterized protein isoform X3 n=1 Tax=Aquarana catesbeiana TaxID=8400 RepID=UPI003CCA0D67
MCPLHVLLLCPLRVLLLWALLCPGTGNVPEEIFTRPGSDLLFPIRRNLTLNHPDTERCDLIYWYYKDPTRDYYTKIFIHSECTLISEDELFSNTRLSENGSLILSNVTPENDGIYIVIIYNSAGHPIQRDYYTVHVEGNVPEEIFTRPGSDLLLPIRRHLTLNHTDTRRCDRIDWYYKDLTRDYYTGIFIHRGCTLSKYENKLFSNTRLSENGSLIISNVTLENDGRYRVIIYNSAGHYIQRDYYTVHVEGNVPEEIFTRLESDLLIPIRRHLILNHRDRGRCDLIEWRYKDQTRDYYTRIFIHRGCTLRKSEDELFSNIRLSENGSLIISNVTPENDGRYSVDIYSRGDRIQRDDYIVHVEVPVSVPLLHVSCLQDGSAEISCRVEEGTKPNIRLSVIGGSQERYSASANHITAFVRSPGPWNITCTVENGVSQSEESRAGVTCPGNVPEEIFTRSGSDLLIPIRLHVTLNHPDRGRCDRIEWKYKDPTGDYYTRIFLHRRCTVDKTENKLFLNTRISENGSLIISNVTPENDGRYSVYIYSRGDRIQRDDYTVHVEVPVSVPLLHVSCLRNGSAEISCRVEEGTKPSIHLSVIGGSQERYSTSANNITAIVGSPGPWNITCTVENGVSRSEESRAGVTCPGNVPEEIFTRPGSDLLLPIRLHLILSHTDTERCDRIEWKYRDPTGDYYTRIFIHRRCTVDKTENKLFLNTRISENGSLIISNVTLGNDGIYNVVMINNRGDHIQTDDYTVHVEVPVSVPLLHVSCLRNGSAEISCRVEEGTKPNIRLSVIGGSQERYSATANNITAIVGSPGSWNITCTVENGVSQSEESRAGVTCPGNVPEEIFTRPGSDLLLPIRRHLTLNHTDTEKCDRIEWKNKDLTRPDDTRIFIHSGCSLSKSENKFFLNTRISENGSLIISNVTLENDGIYSVAIYSRGDRIQRDDYIVHVEVPVSVSLLHVSCFRNGSAEIYCRAEEGTKPNISLSVIGGSQERYSASANNITAIVESPGPWNITCTVENGVSRSEESRAGVTCPVPLSDITVTSSCLPSGRAVAECSVKGSDPRYSWSLDGRSVSSHSRVTLPPPVSGTLHCDVTNQINNLSRSINISCAVPVSDLVLDVRCLQNSSAEISCWVKNGTDPSIYLIVSVELEVYNVTSSERTVRVTVPPVSPPDSWNIRCSAKNDISEITTNQMHDACREHLSGMWSDWDQYLIYGVVGVLCTALLICILTNLRKRKTRKVYQIEMKMVPM